MPRSTFSEPYAEMLRTLVNARRAAGMHQTDLADQLGKPQSFVSKVERGERRLEVIELILVVRAIGVNEVSCLRAVAAAIPKGTRL